MEHNSSNGSRLQRTNGMDQLAATVGDAEASRKRSRKRWLPEVKSPDDTRDVAHLIEDINAAHTARAGNADSSLLIARLLLDKGAKIIDADQVARNVVEPV